MKVIKRVLLVLTVIIWISIVLNACRVENTKKMYPTLPAFDQTNCSEIVIHLCELLVKLTDGELSDDKYYSLQLEIELTYKTIDRGVSLNYYSQEEILQVADSLGCVI